MKPQGTAEGPSAPPARPEATSRETGTEALLEQMLERGNMLQALACLDRLLQQALLQVLAPIFAPNFAKGSYGFREGRRLRQIAGTRKGYWRTAATPQLHKALGPAYWRDQGLMGLLARYERSRSA